MAFLLIAGPRFLDPTNVAWLVGGDPLQHYLGWAFYRLGRYEEALRFLERALELRASDPTINDHLGDIYWRVGRKLEAKFQWNHARDLNPEPEDLEKILPKIEAGLHHAAYMHADEVRAGFEAALDAQLQQMQTLQAQATALQSRLPASVAVIDVWNKADAAATSTQHEGLTLSARTGDGLQPLRQLMLQQAGWQQASEGLFIARERHVQALHRVREHLEIADAHLAAQAQNLDLLAEELRLGQNALNEITGEFSADDLLGVIFYSFCIGK